MLAGVALRAREARRRPGAKRRLGRLFVLVLGLYVIASWQHRFLRPEATIDATYKVYASTGLNRDLQFFYFLYHLDLFPVATDAPINADTKAEALRLLHEVPKQLKQDEGATFRSGDRGRTYLFFVDAWLHHRALKASIIPAHALAFTAALLALFYAFWALRRTAEGAALVILLGSNPLQLFATYRQENVFSWSITTMIALLAIHVSLLARPGRTDGTSAAQLVRQTTWYPWVAAVLAGFVVGAVRNVRGEPTVLVLGPILVYLTMTWLPRWKRGALVLVLAASFMTTGALSRRHLDAKFRVAKATVAAVGGSPYEGPREYYHEFWHAVFCGLGDYGTNKGYAWDDLVAYRSVLPELQAMHPDLPLVPTWSPPRTYDTAGKYPIYYFETPGYHDLVRDKILRDIRAEPKWYLDILWKRAMRILDETTPVGLALPDSTFYLKGRLLGWLWLPLLAFTLLARRWFHAKLLVFSLPLSIAPLMIYSDRGMTFYSTFHVFGAFVFIALAAEGARSMWRARPRR